MDQKTRGWIFIIGALIAGWMGYDQGNWAIVILALLFLISGWHHGFGKHAVAAKKKR